ncbi:MAG: MBL fold metallo-hydrolase [Syntrophales bacterium]
MLCKRIEAEGIAHYSYLIGDEGEAAVIDPRIDCGVYLAETNPTGYRLRHIFETHRHEDFVLGSAALAAATGAVIWHADAQWEYRYGTPAGDGQTWKIGRLTLRAIHSPGHTPGSMSYLLSDPDGVPWMVFTGDALFAGDVGRVDLLGMDQAPAMAGELYDTLFGKLLPLGDGVIVCPAHGSGSVCAGGIGERIWTTIGLERLHNPKLRRPDRAAFISLVAEKLERPPYFRKMERFNLDGATFSETAVAPLSVADFARLSREAIVLDTRAVLAFGAAHIPGALSIWAAGLPSFAGWFLPDDRPIVLVNDADDPAPVSRSLMRLGFTALAGYLSGGMLAWHMAGRGSEAIATVTVQSLCAQLDAGGEPWILDVRSNGELEHVGLITGAHHIHVTELPGRMEEVPRDRRVTIFCGSGLRSMIAASLLKREGWHHLAVVLGGIAGWRSVSCPIRRDHPG